MPFVTAWNLESIRSEMSDGEGQIPLRCHLYIGYRFKNKLIEADNGWWYQRKRASGKGRAKWVKEGN